MAIVDRFREALRRDSQEYTLLSGSQDENLNSANGEIDIPQTPPSQPFSRFDNAVFLFLGIAMLWAWNMYLAASPYFARRFARSTWISTNYQSSIILCGTFTNLVSMLTLAKLQASASYTKRIVVALVINMIAFTLLALSTVLFTKISEGAYLAWVLGSVFCTSCATALLQNGAFALAVGSGQSTYTQAIMTGQAIAGILPPIAQILSVVATASAPKPGSVVLRAEDISGGSALVYFLTATAISAVTLILVIPLIRRRNLHDDSKMSASITTQELASRKTVGLMTLLGKLRWLAAAVFVCFAATMFFPVFTSQIFSTQQSQERSWLFNTATFVPLAFLFWNTGDLTGRLTASTLPSILSRKPQLILIASIARIAFIPLYYLCNLGGRGAIVGQGSVWGDLFYLIIVQAAFGLTNGWLGSLCMMGAGRWVDEGEEEAAGAFMGLMLVSGLTVGSALTFALGI